ncbi:interferon-induced protein 44-like [Chanos chanos]|uniref:Interferon-induced protein 44-like n=1 Tax=Chanos chanos TaxID=29144 RepID=A0A6J2VC69_CHACN|nr:interferon-induced protein 44-like [Chanos chanos]
MSVVTSRLTKEQEKKLCTLLGQAKLSLLFKATVHGYNNYAFHQKCDRQGPTVTVAYNKSGYVFGAYTSKDYAQTGQNVTDDRAFLFSFCDHKPKAEPLRVVSNNPQFAFTDSSTGPNYASLVILYNDTDTVQSNPGTYNFDPIQMHGNDLQLIECEVYRVEDYGGLMGTPWRNIPWKSERKKVLMETITNWRPDVNSVKQARMLLVGPVGAGKSSFFNSVSSVFRGHVTSQANTGSAGTSLTTQFRTYSIKACQKGKTLPIILCDSMGLEEGLNSGMDMDDFTSILRGQMQDRYQFNSSMPLQTESVYFRKSVELKDKIHTVAYVIDASKVKLLPDKMIEKFAALRRKANQMNVPQLVLLTKVDEACPLVAADLKNVYRSNYINRIMREVSDLLGVSLSSVVPVKNYSQELELDNDIDVLLLSAVNQMLRVTEGYFDDIYENDSLDRIKPLF